MEHLILSFIALPYPLVFYRKNEARGVLLRTGFARPEYRSKAAENHSFGGPYQSDRCTSEVAIVMKIFRFPTMSRPSIYKLTIRESLPR